MKDNVSIIFIILLIINAITFFLSDESFLNQLLLLILDILVGVSLECFSLYTFLRILYIY